MDHWAHIHSNGAGELLIPDDGSICNDVIALILYSLDDVCDSTDVNKAIGLPAIEKPSAFISV